MTVDIFNIKTPLGLLDAETKEALRKWEHGVEYFSTVGWVKCVSFDPPTLTYRARPAPLVPDTIDWSHVAPEWKWMARDSDDTVWLSRENPKRMDFSFGSGHADARAFASYRRGTVEWQDSLVQRPE